MELIYFELLSAMLFCIGVYGVLARKHAVLVLMSIELILNAVTINAVAYATHVDGAGITGQIIAIFIITIAAAEFGLALAIILRLYAQQSNANLDEANRMKW
jgi:NADH:ubiquinone oxidoreductase subunit K